MSEQERPTGRRAPFRRRGRDISRLEGFSDAVFAVAITLLVVSFDAPRDFKALVTALQNLPTFAVSFSILAWIWVSQYRFFRRYGLEDGRTVLLTLALLFVVCFYVYPLKFLYTGVFGGITLSDQEGAAVFLIYAAGFVSVFGVLALMHLHAYSRREALGLDRLEVAQTRVLVVEFAGVGAVGLLSAGLAVALPEHLTAAGLVYFLVGAVATGAGWYRGRLARRFG